MKYTLIYLLTDTDYTFFDQQIDGVQKAEINKITAQVYVQTEQVGDFVERMITSHFGGYLIPSEYTGEIVYSEEILNNVDLLPEYPSDFNWNVIEDNLPNYYSNVDVVDSDLLCQYINNEIVNSHDDYQLYVDAIERKCPIYLTTMEWAIHQSVELDIKLFNEAIEAKNKK
jgi:hypothetical protein